MDIQTQLSDTLDLRACLNMCLPLNNVDPCVAEPALDSFERFLDRLGYGTFKLRPENELDDEHLAALRKALAAVCGVGPEQILLRMHRLTALLKADPKGQMITYSVAAHGSVSKILHATEAHACLMKDAWEPVIFHVETALLNNSLLEILRHSSYGLSFSRIFARDIVSFFSCVFAHVCEGNAVMVERLLPLVKIFRSSMPIGLLPRERPTEPYCWQIFVADPIPPTIKKGD